MVAVYQDGVQCFCLPDCTVCRACHKRIEDVDKCPEATSFEDYDRCSPDCIYYSEIWDENELKEELERDEDNELP